MDTASLKDKEGDDWAGTFTVTASPAADDQYMAMLVVQEIPKV